MTEQHIKEQLSQHFMGIMASFKGINITKPDIDYGVDLRLELIEKYKIKGKLRYAPTGKAIDIQLKSTIINNYDIGKNQLKFDLDIQNFNDLIRRRIDLNSIIGGHTPLILVIMLLPEKEEDWFQQDKKGIRLNGNAYWYYPSLDEQFSDNDRMKRIYIPLENRIELSFFESVFTLF